MSQVFPNKQEKQIILFSSHGDEMKHYVFDHVNFIIRSMKRVINETKPGSRRRDTGSAG